MRDDNGIRIRILIKALRICHTDINNTIPVLTTGINFTYIIFFPTRAVDPDPHGSAFIFPPGSGSASWKNLK